MQRTRVKRRGLKRRLATVLAITAQAQFYPGAATTGRIAMAFEYPSHVVRVFTFGKEDLEHTATMQLGCRISRQNMKRSRILPDGSVSFSSNVAMTSMSIGNVTTPTIAVKTSPLLPKCRRWNRA
jgi:hypothetical protein